MLNNLGFVFKAKGQLDKALLAYENIIQIDNKNCIVYFDIGNIYYELNKLN